MAIKVIALSGSLRKESYTTKLVQAFQQFAPKGASLEIIDISQLPFINQDLEADLPKSVKTFHSQIKNADAVLLATPEYNRSYSPVLKNALDWGSRPEGKNKWDKMPCAVIGCTPYSLGAFGAQNHIRQVLMYLNMFTIQQPEFYFSNAAEKFNEKGMLNDKESRKKIDELWTAFVKHIKMVK